MANQFVAEAKARHKTAFFEPEDGTEGAREEDTLDGGECNHAFGKSGRVESHHLRAHFCFPLYKWYGFNCLQKVHLLSWILDVRVDQKQVHFIVDVFDSDLETIETSSFRQRDFCGKVAAEVLIEDAIRCYEKN